MAWSFHVFWKRDKLCHWIHSQIGFAYDNNNNSGSSSTNGIDEKIAVRCVRDGIWKHCRAAAAAAGAKKVSRMPSSNELQNQHHNQCHLISFFQTMQIEMADNALKFRISYFRSFHISIVFSPYQIACKLIAAGRKSVTREWAKKNLAKKASRYFVVRAKRNTKKTVNRNISMWFLFQWYASQHTITLTLTSPKTINYSFTHSGNLCSVCYLLGWKLGWSKLLIMLLLLMMTLRVHWQTNFVAMVVVSVNVFFFLFIWTFIALLFWFLAIDLMHCHFSLVHLK